MHSTIVFLVVAILLRTAMTWASEGAWDFVPGEEDFAGDALLDLRSLNEMQSGETGFVRLSKDGNSSVRDHGAPIRFWAIGSDIYRRVPDETDRRCRFLPETQRLCRTKYRIAEGGKRQDNAASSDRRDVRRVGSRVERMSEQ